MPKKNYLEAYGAINNEYDNYFLLFAAIVMRAQKDMKLKPGKYKKPCVQQEMDDYKEDAEAFLWSLDLLTVD